ncbi:MAG TPA: xanthine dehydrogenase family protein subunit M, partial [Gammaproteobacteria bacterium]|nr:xanthine dehydrogenase family protein subunit M [Gammaproteobacteria bacterium]
WHAAEAEHALRGRRRGVEAWRDAAEAALAGARPRRDNAFKIELMKRTLIRALERAGELP